MTGSPFADLKAPSIELWQKLSGAWNWVLVDTPSPLEPGIVIWDSTEHPTPEAAMAACDAVMERDIREAGF